MSRQRYPLKIYHNQQLMNDTNLMFVKIKKFIYARDKFPNVRPPTIAELDVLMNRIFIELRKDAEILRK